jgi:hypothetical protein
MAKKSIPHPAVHEGQKVAQSCLRNTSVRINTKYYLVGLGIQLSKPGRGGGGKVQSL